MRVQYGALGVRFCKNLTHVKDEKNVWTQRGCAIGKCKNWLQNKHTFNALKWGL